VSRTEEDGRIADQDTAQDIAEDGKKSNNIEENINVQLNSILRKY